MRKLFTGLVPTLVLAVVVQVFLAGRGIFTGSFEHHRVLGYGVVALAVLTTAAALLARVPRRTMRVVWLVLALVVLQPVLAVLSARLDTGWTDVGGIVLGLHAVNAFAIAVMLSTVERYGADDDHRAGPVTSGQVGEPRPDRSR